jgi:hypothetical protein
MIDGDDHGVSDRMKEQKGGETEAFGEIPHECRDVNHRSHKT